MCFRTLDLYTSAVLESTLNPVVQPKTEYRDAMASMSKVPTFLTSPLLQQCFWDSDRRLDSQQDMQCFCSGFLVLVALSSTPAPSNHNDASHYETQTLQHRLHGSVCPALQPAALQSPQPQTPTHGYWPRNRGRPAVGGDTKTPCKWIAATYTQGVMCPAAAQASCAAYRSVVRKDPRFIEFFQAATPVNELGRMNIGSRPAKRKAAGSIDDLRAIPWIFAWTQTRFHLPVWLGIGDAFQARPAIRLPPSSSAVRGQRVWAEAPPCCLRATLRPLSVNAGLQAQGYERQHSSTAQRCDTLPERGEYLRHLIDFMDMGVRRR